MPTLPFYAGQPVSTVPSTGFAGTDLVTHGLTDERGNMAAIGGLVQTYQTRQALVRAEQQQQVGSRALVLQNQLKAAELEAASTTGSADEYLTKVNELTDGLWNSAYEGLNAEQARNLAPRIDVLRSAHEYNIKQREVFKRLDSGRAELAAQGREALMMFRNPDATPYDRAIAQTNYFTSLDESVGSGLYGGVDVEKIKTTFAEDASKLNAAAGKESFVAHYSGVIMDATSDPLERFKMLDALEGPPEWVQATRDEVEDRNSREQVYVRRKESDYASTMGAKIIDNYADFTASGIMEDTSLAPRFRKEMVSLYKAQRDARNTEKDDPVALSRLMDFLRETPPDKLGEANLIPLFFDGGKELKISKATAKFAFSFQSAARAGTDAEVRRKLERSAAAGRQLGEAKGYKDNDLAKFTAYYSNAYLNSLTTIETPLQEKQLADEVDREMEVDVSGSVFDVEADHLFQMTREQAKEMVSYGDLEGWPMEWRDIAINGVAMEIQQSDKVGRDEAIRRAKNLIDNSPKDFRAKAAPYMDPIIEGLTE